MSELDARSEPLTPDPQLKSVDDLSRISELIAGDSPEQPESEAEQPETEQLPVTDPEVDLSLSDSPEPEAEPPGIDYDLEVPMPDGAESVTIGELKDHFQKAADFEKEREIWEDNRIAEDGKLQLARAELNELAGLVGQVNPELLNHLRQKRAANQKQEQEKLLRLYPEWQDPAVKKAASEPLLKTARHLGLSEQEFAQIGDHRLIHGLKLLSTYMARAEKAKAQLEAAPKLPKSQKTVQRKQSKAQQRAEKIKRAKSGTEDDKLAAISSLIRG